MKPLLQTREFLLQELQQAACVTKQTDWWKKCWPAWFPSCFYAAIKVAQDLLPCLQPKQIEAFLVRLVGSEEKKWFNSKSTSNLLYRRWGPIEWSLSSLLNLHEFQTGSCILFLLFSRPSKIHWHEYRSSETAQTHHLSKLLPVDFPVDNDTQFNEMVVRSHSTLRWGIKNEEHPLD